MLVVMLALGAAAAQSSGSAPFDPFVGACWTADFTPTVRDTHCFEAMYGGAHVRDRHEVKENGKVIYAGETIYSLDGKSSVFTYFNSLGGVGHGTLEPNGSTLHFKGSMRASPDKRPQPIDSEWRVIDANHYQVLSLVKPKTGPSNKPLTFIRVTETRNK
jgi:hypothetical protein